MKVKERREIQTVLKDAVAYIEENITDTNLFLCHIDIDLEKDIDGGYNQRMLPNAIDYIKSEKPTNVLNKKHFNTSCYVKTSVLSAPWWIYADDRYYDKSNPDFGVPEHLNALDACAYNAIVNREKIEFLKHLIKKLK